MLAGLTEQQSREIEDALSDMLIRSEAEAVFLCNKGGYILADSVVEEYEHNENIAALAAGSYFATREIARLIGEPEFNHVFHRGTNRSLFMQSTATDLLIIVVFGDQTNPGLIKLCADDMCGTLDRILQGAEDSNEVQETLQAAGITVKDTGPLFRPVSVSRRSKE